MGSPATTSAPVTPEEKKKRQKRAARRCTWSGAAWWTSRQASCAWRWLPAAALTASCARNAATAPVTVRCEIKKPRNVKLHRLVHGLGKLVAQSVDKFAGMDAHTVIKKLQGDAGVCCTFENFDIPDLGRVTRSIPESLAFDEMPEERFREFWTGICQHGQRVLAWPR